ncbi:MAG: hypothetical protein PHT53_03420 [Candidatus Omnitrophica bacterium]|nr:hypothetical protein [Candidatus Omnitrophota bacterium]
MTKNGRLVFLVILFFISSVSFASNVFAQSYIQGGNEIINKIYDDIAMLRKGYNELASFDSGSLKKSRRDELYIVYGEPVKGGAKEKTYIYISYTKLPVSFKGWQFSPSIFYSLKDDLYFGVCLEAKDKLKKDLLAVIEKDIR